jgi:hypothetical protein
MKLSDLSQKDKLAIAEYLYSQESGVLIKSDAEEVIKVFKSHNIKEAETVELEEFAILFLIKNNISREDRNIIMNEYYSGKL